MRAMTLRQPGPIDKNRLITSSLEYTKPTKEEVLIRVSCCGVCRTDLHIVEGDLKVPVLPIIPGHQVVGVVEAIGNEVGNIKEGDRVGLPWMNSTCGSCDYCESNQENLCSKAQFTGLHRHGGYAEYVTTPQQFVYPLPNDIPYEQVAPLLCAGVIGFRTLKLSGIQPGEKLGLYGFGASAHVTIQVARHWDCKVYVFTRSIDHQKHAEELGAFWTGTSKDDPGTELDASLVFAPVGWLMIEALERVRKGGTVISAGIHMSDIPQFPYQLIYGEKTISTAANATYADGAELLQLAGEIPIRTEVEIYSLDKANEALRDLKASRFNGAAVLTIS
ncbi:MAG: zinc-dependent alcohol dehydrogenase family protein [Fidelibacterota bacterium]